ncbi:MAG: RHS repeat-associated core domain-containing protein [Planctomycetota bacterium]|jgi:RHS repeat-associated protein
MPIGVLGDSGWFPRTTGGGVFLTELVRKPAAVRDSGSQSTGSPLFDFQPNSVVQGLDLIQHLHEGSVSTGSLRLTWGEVDFVAPGITPDMALVLGRRYFSGLSHDGVGSTGARWVSSLTETLVPRVAAGGKRALQHFSWEQPYNDSDYYYVEAQEGSGVYTAPAFVGGVIVETSPGAYELTFKDGRRHNFSQQSGAGIRVDVRKDSYGNSITFSYAAPLPLGGDGNGGGPNVEDAEDTTPPTPTLVVTDSRGVSYDVYFDAAGYITKISNSVTGDINYSYTVVGGASYLTTVAFPPRQVMSANGATVSSYVPTRQYTYNAQGRLATVLDDLGVAVLAIAYQSADPSKVATQTDATGAVFTFQEPVSLRTDVITPLGWKRTYLHNSARQCRELRQYIANFSGAGARSTDTGAYYAWQFDRTHSCGCGVVTKLIEPDLGSTELSYTADFDLTEVRKRDASLTQQLVWSWTYDSQHRIVSMTPPEGNASANPALFTTTIARQQSGANLITTTTIPARDWRSTPSVWTQTSDSRGRVFERTGPPHDGSATPSFDGKWTFHASGPGKGLPHQIYMQDASTIAATCVWDAAGRLTSITDNAGRVYNCTYDPEGRPLAWTAPPIHATNQVFSHEWIYDGNGRNRRMRWKHFADQAATASTWIEWFNTYDSMGQVLTRSRRLDTANPPTMANESWTYDLEGNVLTATDADGQVTSATYDERGLPWVITDGVGTPEAATKSYTYNSDGRLSVIIEALDSGRDVRFENEYDGMDRLIRYRIKNAANTAIQAGYVETQYDSGSRIVQLATYSFVGANAQLVDKKTFVYDDYHTSPTRQTSFAYDLATGAQLRAVQSDFDYNPAGRILREYTGATLIADYVYAANGTVTRVQDAHGNRAEFAWDAYKRLQTESNVYKDQVSGAYVTTVRTFFRDQFGRVTSIKDAGTGVADQFHYYELDSCDNLVKHIGPDGSAQRYQYRLDGALTREDVLSGASTLRATKYQLTPGGRRHVVTDDRNNNVTHVYDGRGRLKQEVYQDGSVWTNLHNASGLLTKIVAPSGRSVDLTYDWRGMIAGAVYKDGAGVTKRSDVFDIDLGGFVKRVTKTEGGVTQYVDMANDSTGRVLSETTVVPSLPTWTVSYNYDALGRMVGITSPHGYQHLYQYDDRNRVSGIQLSHQGEGLMNVAEYKYLGSGGNVRQRTTMDGNVLNVTRDGHCRVTRLLTNGAASVADFQYGYDSGNRVSYEHRAFDGKGDAYWYDSLGRLTQVTKDSVNPAAEISGGAGTTAHALRRVYNLDGDSHRTTVVKTPSGGSPETTTYATHGIRHYYTQIQVGSQPAVSRTFDTDGRLTASGGRTFHYDAADNLIEVKDGVNTVASYGFDALGRRITKNAGMWQYRFVHAGPWMIEDYRRIKTEQAWYLKGGYVHGPGIDNIVMMRHRDWVDQDSDVDKVEPKNIYFHANSMGSVSELTGEDGLVVERYRYDEYGKPTVLDANGIVLSAAVAGNSFLFTGREYDWETGLYHYRARAYDPDTGTFLQEDPLGLHDGLNVVAYVHANPTNLSDPYGTDGIADMITGIMDFINANRALIAGLVMDLLGPLEGILDLLSAATGKDITGWLRGGMKGEPEAMGWWDRTCAAASAALSLAAGALKLIPKLKDIFKKIEAIVEKATEQLANAARHAVCPIVGGCFVIGTLVAMDNAGMLPIERVPVGSVVESALPGATPFAEPSDHAGRVLATWLREYAGAIHTLVIQSGDGQTRKVQGTPDHPFWVSSKHCWVPMSALMPGDTLDGLHGGVRVMEHHVEFATVWVANLTVDESHSYRVTDLGVLVHNIKKYKEHGNAANDAPAFLYAKFAGDGSFQKWGVTKDLNKRYTKTQLQGGRLEEIDRGPRSEMLRNERYLTERLPGVDNREPWAGSAPPGN